MQPSYSRCINGVNGQISGYIFYNLKNWTLDFMDVGCGLNNKKSTLWIDFQEEKINLTSLASLILFLKSDLYGFTFERVPNIT